SDPALRASQADSGTRSAINTGASARQRTGAGIMGCRFCNSPFCAGNCNVAIMQQQIWAAQQQAATIPMLGGLGSLQQLPMTNTPPKPIENAGMKVEDLIGWRIWSITPTGLLKSFSANHIWLPDVPMEGNPGDHDSQGVWAFKDEIACAAKLAQSPQHVMG